MSQRILIARLAEQKGVIVNKRRAVENMLDRLGRQTPASQIVEALRRYDVDASETLVTKVKDRIEREQARADRQRAGRLPKNKSRRRPQQRKIPRRKR